MGLMQSNGGVHIAVATAKVSWWMGLMEQMEVFAWGTTPLPLLPLSVNAAKGMVAGPVPFSGFYTIITFFLRRLQTSSLQSLKTFKDSDCNNIHSTRNEIPTFSQFSWRRKTVYSMTHVKVLSSIWKCNMNVKVTYLVSNSFNYRDKNIIVDVWDF